MCRKLIVLSSLALLLGLAGNTSAADITEDTTWSGEVLVTEMTYVRPGATLTIMPDTMVRFQYYRGYKQEKVGLWATGGNIQAIGTPAQQIWFTSSDPCEPVNGDWAGIAVIDSTNSEFDYVIVEYGEIGIEQFNSDANISNSIGRWNNSEGWYAEESTATFQKNRLYENAYHAIALENYNPYVQVLTNIIDGPRRQGVMLQNTTALIQGNHFKEFTVSDDIEDKIIWVVYDSNATIQDNKFDYTGTGNPIYVEDGSTATDVNNAHNDPCVPGPVFDYNDTKLTELPYLIGDPEDQYLYVYDVCDETRRTVERYGAGLGLGWTAAYAQGGLWRFDAGGMFIKIDPVLGIDYNYEYANPDGIEPRGICYDGTNFWANDHMILKIVEFKLGTTNGYDSGSGYAIETVSSFDTPTDAAIQGIATDGDYLYIPHGNGSAILKYTKTGSLVSTINCDDFVGPSLTWTGTHFWSAGGLQMLKYAPDGTSVGWIWPPAKETWDISYDGTRIWTAQQTCENWNDDKIFKVEIIDDSDPNWSPPDYNTPPAGGDVADSDIPFEGTVTGSYTDTHDSNDVYEWIEEVVTGGNPAKRYSFLEHKWTFNVTGGTTVTFYVEAHHSYNTENDDFVFAYSTDNSTYTDMLTVTKVTDEPSYQTYVLPSNTSGTVYIRVKDTDQGSGNKQRDKIFIDHMCIVSETAPGVTITESGGSTDVAEEGPTSDTYTIVLDTEPTDTVTITVDPDIETEVNNNGAGNPVDLTFLTSNWDVEQTVTVTAIDDTEVEGAHTSSLTHSAVSNDTDYNGISIDNVVANVTDNDGGPTDDVADSDIPVKGTVSGSYTDTHTSNNVYESIQEIESTGNPANRYSYLEHKWTISVTGGTTVTFYVEAYHTANTENDDFVFAYSTDDSSYTDMLTVTKTSDDNAYQSYVLPSSTSGTVYIRVTDTDRTAGNKTLDTIYVDHMYIRSE